MSDTSPPPVKRPAKKAAPRATAQPEAPKVDTEVATPIPTADDVLVIEPIIKRYRYMFRGGRILDVDSPYRADSTDREMALVEAQRRWGGKKDDWKIEGVTALTME